MSHLAGGTFIGRCCREWVLSYHAALNGGGRCGLCGETPTWVRRDDFYDETDSGGN